LRLLLLNLLEIEIFVFGWGASPAPECRRSWLYQSTHSSVASSTSASMRQVLRGGSSRSCRDRSWSWPARSRRRPTRRTRRRRRRSAGLGKAKLQSGLEALRRGWRGIYLPILGAVGQHAPDDVPNYYKQRARGRSTPCVWWPCASSTQIAAPGSIPGTRTHDHSSGPRPPTRSSIRSLPTATESTNHDTGHL
jgi:hypothetical protein